MQPCSQNIWILRGKKLSETIAWIPCSHLSQNLDHPPLTDKLCIAMDASQSGKSPGLDGISAGLHKCSDSPILKVTSERNERRWERRLQLL